MEYRSWIKIPGLPLRQEAEHERLYEMLLRDHDDLGPVMTWDRDATVVIIAIDARDEATAAAAMCAAVVEALHASDLGHLYPGAIELESVDDSAVE